MPSSAILSLAYPALKLRYETENRSGVKIRLLNPFLRKEFFYILGRSDSGAGPVEPGKAVWVVQSPDGNLPLAFFSRYFSPTLHFQRGMKFLAGSTTR